MDFLCKSNFEYKIKFILGYEIILYIRNHSDGNLRRLLCGQHRQGPVPKEKPGQDGRVSL